MMSKIKNIVVDFIACSIVFSFGTIIAFRSCPQFSYLGFINDFLDLLMIIMLGVIIIYSFLQIIIHNHLISRQAMLILFFYLYYIIITYVNDGNVFRSSFLVNISMIIGLDSLISSNNYLFIKKYMKWSNILILINFLSVIIFHKSQGITYIRTLDNQIADGVYFLGGKNGHILSILPIMCFDYMLYRKEKNKFFLFCIIIGILNSILIGSATSIVMQLLWIMIIICIDKENMNLIKLISNWPLVLIVVIVVFLFFIANQGFTIFSDLFMFLFHKDMVSQNRGVLYSIGLDRIKESFLTGYGYLLSGKFTIDGYESSHDFIIDCLLYGGIVALVWYMLIIMFSIRSARKNYKDKRCLYILAGVLSFLIGGFVDGYQFYPTWALFNCMCLALMRWTQFKCIADDM